MHGKQLLSALTLTGVLALSLILPGQAFAEHRNGYGEHGSPSDHSALQILLRAQAHRRGEYISPADRSVLQQILRAQARHNDLRDNPHHSDRHEHGRKYGHQHDRGYREHRHDRHVTHDARWHDAPPRTQYRGTIGPWYPW